MKPNFRVNSELLRVVKSAFALLGWREQRKIKQIALVQILLSFLDLLGIALFGLVASLAVTGINSKTPGGTVERILNALNLGSSSFQSQTAVLATLALAVFIIRTVLSMFFIRRTLNFLGRCAAEIATCLFGKVLAQPLTDLGKYSSQQYIYSLTTGIETLTLRVIGSAVSVIADAALLIFVLGALVYVSLPMTIIACIVVGGMSWVLHQLTTVRSRALGVSYTGLEISSRESLVDVLTSFRQIASMGRLAYYKQNFQDSRGKVSTALAEYNFMPFMGKYVIESAIFVSAFMVAGAQFLLSDAINAVTTLSVFMAAGSRLAPAVLRIQQGFLNLNNSWGRTDSTLTLISEIKNLPSIDDDLEKFKNEHHDFQPKIELANVAFRYPLSNSQTLESTSLVIEPGESIALVGPSGSGKTTLIDLMLGLLTPQIGEVKISGVSPKESIQMWPGAIGYVPQEMYISNATVAANVALGFSVDEIPEINIWHALEKAQIADFISSLDDGLSTLLGDRGIKLSGGQKQRLGIARALLTKPRVLFLDEATSALDSQTEYEVSEAINGLRGEVTLIVIAHRLSTAKRADRVIYLEAGKLMAQGSFDEVKRLVPNFQKQAELMDLGQ
jgi:ABC-type multidrug transport system fused ATPase/permease subunit